MSEFFIYHRPNMASPVLRAGHATRSGHYWVGVIAARAAPYTKWGANHKTPLAALRSAMNVLKAKRWPVAVFERGTGRCMWDSRHGPYVSESFDL